MILLQRMPEEGRKGLHDNCFCNFQVCGYFQIKRFIKETNKIGKKFQVPNGPLG